MADFPAKSERRTPASALREWWQRRAERRQRKHLPKFLRGQARFRERYPNYEIGIGTYGMPKVHDWHEGSTLRIGAYCSIAEGVNILLGGHHRLDWVSSYPFPKFLEEARHIADFGGTRGDVTIGNDVWLGTGCTILSGISIGDGAVVAAQAVVTRDVAPYAIVAGNPARIVRWRFDETTRAALLATAWWSWPEAEIRRVVSLLCSDDPGAFLAYAADRNTQSDTTGETA
ncbi:CatB-related O-acetyltransferase [Aromatoleum diolicum]|uniref:Antibiotic acetyltransferase n=1 Tax=Aromatoleum diolicum TaxID=75796 RepID=A0ABX1QGS1_9RHOO|nr:CatB-related O-acetyltransferase [Aromatoleum diolicum]NMG77190.1 antibiotic acetyltransferase [Aromatoleum diolicum]